MRGADCDRCRTNLAVGSHFCSNCGAAVHSKSAGGTPGTLATPRDGPVTGATSTPPRARAANLVLLVAVLAIVVGVEALAQIPVAHPLAFTMSAPGSVDHNWPSGTDVRFSWHTTDGTSAYLQVTANFSHDPTPTFVPGPVYYGFGPSGSGEFTATGQPYLFLASDFSSSTTIQISGTAAYPVL
ncbi:MAG: hypothetical protein L3K09_03560 [Thermoplasmata archaeon]|nr:hypothetical protein [Thermoplasmata archaeon]